MMKKISNKSVFFLSVILLISIFVRFYRLDLKMRFIWDEGRDMMAIHNIVANKDLTLMGPFNEIDGKKDFFGVFHYYLMAPSLFLADYDPVGPAVFTAFLGFLSVGLLFFLIRQWSTDKVALLTSFFYAISPLVIKYVQWSWNPNTLPFFAFLYLLILTRLFKTGDKRLLLTSLSGLILGLMFQLHYFSIPLGIVYLLIFLNDKKKKWLEPVLFSLFFVLPNLSFLLFDLMHDFFYFKILKETFIGGSGQKYFSFNLVNFLIIPFKFIFDLLMKLFFGNKLLVAILEIIFFWEIFKSINKYFKKKTIDLKILLSFVWLVFFLMIGFFPTLFDEYHSSYLWFGFFYFFVDFFKHKKLVLIFYFLIALLMFRNIELNRESQWSENLPLVRELGMIVVSDYKDNFKNRSVNLASFTDSDTRATRYRYFLQKENIKADGIDQYPNTEVLYIISPHSIEKTKKNFVWEIESFVDLEWVTVGEAEGVFVYRGEK